MFCFVFIFLWLFGRFRYNSFQFFREMPASSSPYIKSLSILFSASSYRSRQQVVSSQIVFTCILFFRFLYIVCDLIVVITFIHYQIVIRIIKCWDHAYYIHYLWAVQIFVNIQCNIDFCSRAFMVTCSYITVYGQRNYFTIVNYIIIV